MIKSFVFNCFYPIVDQEDGITLYNPFLEEKKTRSNDISSKVYCYHSEDFIELKRLDAEIISTSDMMIMIDEDVEYQHNVCIPYTYFDYLSLKLNYVVEGCVLLKTKKCLHNLQYRLINNSKEGINLKWVPKNGHYCRINWNHITARLIFKNIISSFNKSLIQFKELIKASDKKNLVESIEIYNDFKVNATHIEELAKYCPNVKKLTKSFGALSCQIWRSFRHFKKLQVLPYPEREERLDYELCANFYKTTLTEYYIFWAHPFGEGEELLRSKLQEFVRLNEMISSLPRLKTLLLRLDMSDEDFSTECFLDSPALDLSLIVPHSNIECLFVLMTYDKYVLESVPEFLKFRNDKTLKVEVVHGDTVDDYDFDLPFLRFEKSTTTITIQRECTPDELLNIWRNSKDIEGLIINHVSHINFESLQAMVVKALCTCQKVKSIVYHCYYPLIGMEYDDSEMYNPFLEEIKIRSYGIDLETYLIFSESFPSLKRMEVEVHSFYENSSDVDPIDPFAYIPANFDPFGLTRSDLKQVVHEHKKAVVSYF
ncbi:unnamed protein product [Rhizopus stolonifer]